MGRYDKIKVYDGTEFKDIKRMYIHNGTDNIDLGTNDSDNKTTLMVYTDLDTLARVTLNKKSTTVLGTKTTAGSFSLVPASGFCACTKATGDYARSTWYFKTKIMRDSLDKDLNVFRCGSGANYEVRITWLSNGAFKFRRAYRDKSGEFTTPDLFNTLMNVYEISFQIDKDTNVLVVNITDTVTDTTYTYTHALGANSFTITNATNTVGDSGVYLSDYIKAQGVKYANNIYTKDLLLADMKTGDSNDYKGLTINQTESTELVEWT